MNYTLFHNALDLNIEDFIDLPFNYTYHLTEGGTRVRSPRKMCWFAENATWCYQFSRSHIEPLWPYTFAEYSLLDNVKAQVENIVNHKFNCCLVNIYTDGSEYADWHDDNEPWLGDNPIIASVSIGATRSFEIKRKSTQVVTSFNLQHNDILLMNTDFQDYYQHRLPINEFCTDKRINLTFRKIIPSLVHSPLTKPYWHS